MTCAKIGFVLCSNTRNPLASSRISVLNMLPYLRTANYDPHILFEPEEATSEPQVSGLAQRVSKENIDIAYFQKVRGRHVVEEAKKISAMGVKTVFGVCDLIDDEMAEVTDATIAVTAFVKSLFAPRLHDKIHIVHDGIENPDIHKTTYDAAPGSATAKRPIRAVLITSTELYEIPVLGKPPPFVEITVIGRYPPPASTLQRAKNRYWNMCSGDLTWRDRYLFLRHCVRREFKTVKWDANTVHRLMMHFDVGIIPVWMKDDPLPYPREISHWQMKSENRLTMNMALGLPVIASPVPSYTEVIVQGHNGYLAGGRDEWIRYLGELRDPRRRQAVGESARDSVINRFSKDEQAKKLIEVLDRVKRDLATSPSSRGAFPIAGALDTR